MWCLLRFLCSLMEFSMHPMNYQWTVCSTNSYMYDHSWSLYGSPSSHIIIFKVHLLLHVYVILWQVSPPRFWAPQLFTPGRKENLLHACGGVILQHTIFWLHLSVCLKSLVSIFLEYKLTPSPSLYPIHLCCSLHTDMLFGHCNGLRTLLVFSGVTKRSDLPSAKQEEQPEFICDSVASLLTCKP